LLAHMLLQAACSDCDPNSLIPLMKITGFPVFAKAGGVIEA
jgi:hypothetical protein